MWEILKFVAYAFIALLILAFALPLLWLVIQMIGWLFGGVFAVLGAGNFISICVIIISIIAIIIMASK